MGLISSQDRTAQLSASDEGLKCLDAAMLWLDAQYRVAALNRAAEALTGLRHGHTIGCHIDHLPIALAGEQCPLSHRLHGNQADAPRAASVEIHGRSLVMHAHQMRDHLGVVGWCVAVYERGATMLALAHGESSATDPTLSTERLLKLPVCKRNRILLLEPNAVVRLQADGHYTHAHTQDASYLCNLALSELARRLDPERFMRVHRSHMVNLDLVVGFERVDDQCALRLRGLDEARVPVSRSHLPRLKALFGLR